MAHDLYEQVSLNGNSKSIRILQLSTVQDRPLEGHLKEVSLTSNPTYYALSYTWGGPSDACYSILCHASGSSKPASASLEITASCYDALTQLRRTLAPRGWPRSFNIWVDAICIDQSVHGEVEKLAQIPLMREIYEKAQKVYLWLGPETESSNYTIDWIREASLGHLPLLGVKYRSFPANMIFPSEVAKLMRMAPELLTAAYYRWNPKPATMKYNSQHTQDIFLRPWFTRMWTVQELVMASEPIVICGSRSIRWDQFSRVLIGAFLQERKKDPTYNSNAFGSLIYVTSFWYDIYRKERFSQPITRIWANQIPQPLIAAFATRVLDFIEDHGRSVTYIQGSLVIALVMGQLLRGLRPLNTVWIIPPIYSMLFTLLFWPQPRSDDWSKMLRGKLMDVLNTTRHRQAKQPEDKVYAIYGVLAALDFDLKPLVGNTPFEDVYFDFAKQIINWHGSLNILGEAGIPPVAGESRLQNIPSWVPDWRWPLDRISFRRGKPAKESSPAYVFSESGLEITTKGIVVDTVDYVTPLYVDWDTLAYSEQLSGEENNLATCLMSSIQQLYEWMQRVNQQSQLSATLDRAVFEVLNSNAEPALYHDTEFYAIFCRWFTAVFPDILATENPAIIDSHVPNVIAHDTTLLQYHKRLLKLAADRTIFVTTQGFIGTGPSGTFRSTPEHFFTPEYRRESYRREL